MRPNEGRFSLWPLGVIGLIVVLTLASTEIVSRLNSSPPADFVALRVNAKGSNAASAAAYWDTAVEVIQLKYLRTASLPVEPPAEFRLGDDAGKTGKDEAARLAYWAKLREEWMRAESWHTTVKFDPSWIYHDLQAVWREADAFITDHL